VWIVPVAVLCLATVALLADSGPAHQVKQTPPIKLGTSGSGADFIGPAFCCGGTLGSAVLYGGQLHILSNNHILAQSGSAAPGEDTLQPGLIDSACQVDGDNIVGDFIGNVVPLGTANVDVALSLARSGMVDTSGAILDIGPPCPSPLLAPTIGMGVVKSGRTTGCSNGTVQATNVNVKIQYQVGCNQGKKFTITYTNQISTTRISAGGDSGSLILSTDGLKPTALLYAGSSTVTIGNPIEDVINAFTTTGKSFSFVGSNKSCSTAGFACPAAAVAAPAAAFVGLGPSAGEVEFARRIKERHEPDLFARPGVVGVGVGSAEGDPTRAAIVVYVVSHDGARPRGLPAELDGVKVRVIPTEPFVAF